MPDKWDKDRDMVLIAKAMNLLREHFDTCQVFVTRHGDDGTVAAQRGFGNYYARRGQVHKWLIQEDEENRWDVRKEMDRNNDEGSNQT